MGRNTFTFKDLTAAIRAPFMKRSRLLADNIQDYAWDNDFITRHAKADDSGDVLGFGIDADNALRVGNAAISPQVQAISFEIGANGSIGTTQFLIADRDYYIVGATYMHKTAGSGTATTASITHEKGNQLPGTGVSIQTGTFTIKTTAATVQTATLNGETSNKNNSALLLKKGERLSFTLGAGTITSYAGPVVTVYLTPGNKSEVAIYAVHANADVANQTFVLANRDLTVQAVYAIYGTAFAASTTIDITQETTTGAPGSGTSILSAAMAGDGAAQTMITPTLAAASALYIPAGNRLSTKFSATTTGADVLIVVVFQPLYNRREITFQLAANAQQQVSQNMWISDGDYQAIDLSLIFHVAAGGAATGNLEVCKGTTAAGSGTLLASAISLNGTPDTVVVGTMGTTRACQISKGDRIGWAATTGAAQAIADLCVTLSLLRRS